MTQYLMTFHHFPIPAKAKPSAAEFEAVNKQWASYLGGIATNGKFVSTQLLDQAGSIIGPDGKATPAVTEGKGLIVGTLTVQAKDFKEAIALTKGCPILSMGGSVEVRPVLPFEV